MEEPKCITSCLICESQISPTNNGDGTDTRASISILKNVLLQQNEADVKAEKQNSEAIRLFCPACTEILNEWHEIQDSISKLLTRSKGIKYRLIVNILESKISLPGQLQDSTALKDLLKDFATVKRAVINEYQPRLQLQRLAGIPFDPVRNCSRNDDHNHTPADLLEISLGLDQEDYHDDWEASTCDAAETDEFQYDDDQSDELNRESGTISGHVMTAMKRKSSPTEQCDDRTPKEKRIQETEVTSRRTRPERRSQTSEVHVLQDTLKPDADKSVPKKRSVVYLDNGDFLYDGKYTVKFRSNKYWCPVCRLQRKGKYNMMEHIREDHIRAKADEKRKKRSIVSLGNGDILYDGKYTIKLNGKKYLCPLCGLQRQKKYSLTDHILADHIRGNGSNDITAVAENTFLYLNQYVFTFSNNQYKCSTCGIALDKRPCLIDHIQVCHVNAVEPLAGETSAIENSHAKVIQLPSESGTTDTNDPPSGPRKSFKCIPITENVFLYAGKYRIVFKGGRYKCPKCSCMMKQKFAIMQHIREKHIKNGVVPRKVRPFNRIVTINENEFMYVGKYRITKKQNEYFCSECPTSRPTIQYLADHIRVHHIRKKEVPDATPESKRQRDKPNNFRCRLKKIGPNEYLYGGQVRISITDGGYTCGSCGIQMKTLMLMRYHAIIEHIRYANDEFYKSIETLEDGTLKCGKCEYIGKKWARMEEHIQKHKSSLKQTGSAELRKYNYSVEVSPNHFDHGGWPYRFDTETGRFNCGSCNFTFRTKSKIIGHISARHSNPVETVMCEECGKTFANKDNLRSHKTRHRPKTVPCPECDKLFVTQEDLKGHLKTHLGEAAKTQVCEFCGKGFFKLNQLEKHRSTHADEAPYKCDACGVGYRTQKGMINHQKTKHPKETLHTVPPVDSKHAVVAIEIVDELFTDISAM